MLSPCDYYIPSITTHLVYNTKVIVLAEEHNWNTLQCCNLRKTGGENELGKRSTPVRVYISQANSKEGIREPLGVEMMISLT